MTATNEQILRETQGLRGEVAGLRKELASSKAVVRRLRLLTLAVAGIFLIGGLLGVRSVLHNKETAQAGLQAQIVQCQNANEQREAFRDLWDFILGYELSDPNNNPAETSMSEMILPWIHKTWETRDCSDLRRKYTIPDPPKIPKTVKSETTVY